MGHVRVLINDAIKRYLLAAPELERRQLRKSFEYLENGLWEGGLRVKKLSGASQVVLEARLNRADRLLFTLGRQPDESRSLLVYAWAVVAHDDVERKARAIDSAATPFLAFESREVLDLTDVDMDGFDASVAPEGDSFGQPAASSAPQRWYVLDEAEWQRLLQYSKDEFEIFLHLTPQQRELLEKDPPLMVSGTAGSGKTTLSVYYLLRRRLLQQSCLFLTYNAHLRNFCRRLYDGLLNERADRPSQAARFLTLKELCLELAGPSRERFAADREVDARAFQTLFRKHKLSEKLDPALVWEEIRSIVKGAKPQISAALLRGILKEWKTLPEDADRVRILREELLGLQLISVREKADSVLKRMTGRALGECARELEDVLREENTQFFRALQAVAEQVEKHEADFNAPLMTLAEYEQLGKKRAPSFVHSRPEIYSIAQWYQSQLEEQHLWDEIDLARVCIRNLDRNSPAVRRYDFVCCDEIQDLTGIQLSLLVRLPKNPEMLMLSGDPKQIINPSGFRWEEVRGLFYDRRLTVPEVHHLTLNFRCVGSIVALSNVLLQIKQELLGVRSEEKPDESKFQGQPPFLVESVDAARFQELLRTTGADRIILTRDEAERDRMKRELDTELVFTIEEAKGLEFRSVMLWKFCREGAVQDLWSRILRADTARIHEAAIRHELNLLYVGITRAQRNLILYDGANGSVIWNDPRIEDLIFRTASLENLEHVWQSISTPEDWERQADYFFEREHYRAAAECYRNAGQPLKMFRAQARAAERHGDWSAAARFWEQAGDLALSAEAWERAFAFEQALALWELLERPDRALPCRIAILEANRQYAEAAELWEQLEQWERARKDWQLAHRPDRLAILFEREGNWIEAAHHYRDSRQWEKAAQLFVKERKWEDAARCFQNAGRDAEALPLWKKLSRSEEVLQCLLRLKDGAGLAEFYEEHARWKEAMDSLKAAHGDRLQEVLELQIAEDRTRKAGSRALRYSLLGRSEEAAPLWERVAAYDLAAADYQACGRFQEAARCMARIQRWPDAVKLTAQAGDLAGLGKLTSRWIARDGPPAQSALSTLARDFERANNTEVATRLFAAAGAYVDAARLAAARGDDADAVTFLMLEKDDSAAADFLIARQWWTQGALVLPRKIVPYWNRSTPALAPMERMLLAWKKSGIAEGDLELFHATMRDYLKELSPLVALPYLEENGYYDGILDYLDSLIKRTNARQQEPLRAWADEAKSREAAGDLAGAGLRYFVRGVTEKARLCWSRVEPGPNNLQCLRMTGNEERVDAYMEELKKQYAPRMKTRRTATRKTAAAKTARTGKPRRRGDTE